MKRLYASYHTEKKMDTSKKLLVFAVALVVVITIVTVISVFSTGDVTPLEFLITGIFGLASTAYGFYYWKAKNENINKYGDNVKENDYEDYT